MYKPHQIFSISLVVFSISLANLEAKASIPVIELAFQGPLSGQEAEFGDIQLGGVEFAVNKFNSFFQGKIKVKLQTFDDQGDPSISAEVSKQASEKKEIIGMIGPIYSAMTVAGLENYKSKDLFLISPSASRTSLTDPAQGAIGYPVFHRIVPVQSTVARALYNWAIKGVVSPRILIVEEANIEYSIAMSKELQNIAPTSQVVGKEILSTDVRSVISRVQSTNTNIIIFTSYYPKGINLFQQLRSSGFRGTLTLEADVPDPNFFDTVPVSALDGLKVVSSTSPLININPNLEIEFRRITGLSSAGMYVPESIEATNIFLTCIASGSRTRTAIGLCIDTYDGKSLFGGRISFDSWGDNTRPNFVNFQIKSGELSYIASTNDSNIKQGSELSEIFGWGKLRISNQATRSSKKPTPQITSGATKIITCIKGKEVKRVSTTNGKCPTGFTQK
jgi:branched-chain amino acid transport system substrate-binding protein